MRILHTTLLLAALTGATLASAADPLFKKKSGPSDFLPVDQAFELQPLEYRDGKLTVSWRIAKNYYLYRNRFKFALTAPAGAPLEPAVFPVAEKYEDEHFGTTEIYRSSVSIKVPASGTPAGPLKLSVSYQGCADAGLCYPIQTRTLDVTR